MTYNVEEYCQRCLWVVMKQQKNYSQAVVHFRLLRNYCAVMALLLSIVNRYTVETILLGVVVLLVIYFIQQHLKWKKRYCFPPGPNGLPLLGIFYEIFDYPAHLAYTGNVSFFVANANPC